MIKHLYIALLFSISLLQSQEILKKETTIKVSDKEALHEAISKAKPGDNIVMANGVWENIQIRFSAKGTKEQPITLRAETEGKVSIEGKSDLKLAGEYLNVKGLYFKNGFSPTRAVVEYRIDNENIAFNSTISNCVIEDYNKPQRNMTDFWVVFRGRNNKLENCYIAGKSNRGPTVRVILEGNESVKNYHKIINNHFGPRPPKGGASAETIQIGNSATSMAPSYTLVANNLFERCNGEVEIISSKSNFNEFRNNVFYKSEGSLVTRHGAYCTVDGNYFIGDGTSEQMGGIRLIGTGHWVTNNYFYNLKGNDFRSPLAVMNGIPKASLNRYLQVTDVVIAHNSWINCKSPLQFGVGVNTNQKDVLPKSEIRSARPTRTIVANNLIYNKIGDKQPIITYDSIEGVKFKNNIIDNKNVVFKNIKGITKKSIETTTIADDIVIPTNNLAEVKLYNGFEFESISKDIFGNDRNTNNIVGAISNNNAEDPKILDKSKYGTSWFSNENTFSKNKTHIAVTTEDLIKKIEEANNGDIIKLISKKYELPSSLKINKKITLQTKNSRRKVTITYSGEEGTPAFEMNPKGDLTLKNIILKGNNKQHAFASLKENMSSLYNLSLENSQVENFAYVLKGYKYSFAEYIRFNNTTFKNCTNGIELAAEKDDKGDYNAENIFITNCTFSNISANVVNYYRGGYDESTVGGNLVITKSKFTNCGSTEKNNILLNTYGIMNVDISNNTFENNPVKLVALLWGAKNNKHFNNTINNSGKITVEENIKLNLLY